VPWYHARSCEEGEGHFKGRAKADRNELTRRLIDAFNQYEMLRVVGTTSVRDYDLIIPSLVKEQIYKHPWHLGFQHCIDQSLRWTKHNLAFVHDQQTEFKPWALERFNQIRELRPEPRLVSVTIADKAQRVPLQVADLVTFYMTKWQRRMLLKRGRKLPVPALQLVERAKAPYQWFAMEHFSAPRLKELASRGAEEIALLEK
jgi:hypothetical protein